MKQHILQYFHNPEDVIVLETSGGGWQVVSVGDVQVEGVPLRERRWGDGSTERCCNDDLMMMEGC